MVEQTISKITKAIQAEIDIPGDKSISHRSIIFGSIANGLTEVSNFLTGEDCICTMEAFRALGVKIDFDQTAKTVKIHGKGFAGLKAPSQDIYLGNSGTGMRLLAGLFAGLPFETTLTGDQSLSGRPMARVIDPLTKMGAVIESNDGKAPLIIKPSTGLKAIKHHSRIASAQVKSSILLAGLNAEGTTTVIEPEKSRDHTERMMQGFGVELEVNGLEVSIKPLSNSRTRDESSRTRLATKEMAELTEPSMMTSLEERNAVIGLSGQVLEVPGDISSAAFFMVAGAILDKAELKLINVGINPTRTGILDVLTAMKVDYKLKNQREVNKEPIADIVIYNSKIKATTIAGDIIPRLIDEIPVIAVLAAQAEGVTVIKDAAELKVKESNRIATTINMLTALGVKVKETDDGMIIEGRAGKDFEPVTTTIDSYGDHRLAMSSAIAALKATKPITILQTEFVATSFPDFFDIINTSLRGAVGDVAISNAQNPRGLPRPFQGLAMTGEIKSLLQDIGLAAYNLGHEIYLVGGYVRNHLMHELHGYPSKQCYDLDLVINTNAIEFIQRLQKYRQDNHPKHLTFEIIEEFKQFGTVKIKDPEAPEYSIEIASTRTETYEEPADFPKVTIIDNIQDDLTRRDFTINALLESINPLKSKHPFGEILDSVGGLKDIKHRLIRVFHKDSFIDDPTRIYRAARFAAEYDFEIETQTWKWMQAAMQDPRYPEWFEKRKNRFAIELEKIKTLANKDRALEILNLTS